MIHFTISHILREINRIKIPLLLLTGWVVWFGFTQSLMTASLLTGFFAMSILLGHIVGKEIFGKYKWDVGEKLNEAWGARSTPKSILAVGMLFARVIIFAAIVIGLSIVTLIMKGI